MQIQSIRNNQKTFNKIKTSKPSFKAWTNVVLDPKKIHKPGSKPKHMNNTAFFRLNSMWENFINFIVNKYKNVDKVHVYNYGCSDGSEPISLAMILKSKHQDLVQKFLPVVAKDYDINAIDKALTREYIIGTYEKGVINKFTKNEFTRYFEKKRRLDSVNELCVLKPELYKDVKFSVANILEDYKNINPENSFVMARNFWPYLSDEDKLSLAKSLSQQMQKNCTLMIGEFDLQNRWSKLDIRTILLDAGFKATKNTMIFEK